MCERRRATFQKTEIEQDGRVCPVYSMNLSRAQAVVSILTGMAVFLTSIFAGMAWARTSIVEAASQDFQKAMDAYYARIIPERNAYYERLVTLRIKEHRIAAEAPFDKRLDEITSEQARQGTNIDTLVRRSDHMQEVLVELLLMAKNGHD